MSEHLSPARISRRSLLRGTAAAAVAAGLPLSSCTSGRPPTSGRSSGTGTANVHVGDHHIANVHVSDDQYGFHVEPSVAANPRHPRQLLAACQVSHTAHDYRYGPGPEFIATYLSVDGGASWRSGGLPQLPAGTGETRERGDDVTVAFDPHGRGYVCATAQPGGERAMYAWRTDNGGHSFSAPVTLLAGQYLDHPGIAAGAGQTLSQRNVYVVWAGGGNPSDLAFTRSTDGGESFESARTILMDHRPSVDSAGPALAAGAHGLVCAVCHVAAHQDSSGDMVGQAVAVCSTDAGQSFAPPVPLGSSSLDIGLPGGVKPKGSEAVAVAPHGDALYAAYTTHQPGATHSDIVVTASHDRGRTWSKPVTATPDDSVTYFQPNLAVDEAGRVAISVFALAGGKVDEVLLVSAPRQLRFQAPLRVTTAPFDPRHNGIGPSPKEGAWWIGDYQGITTSGGAFHLVWNDTRTGNLDLFAATVRP